MSPENSVALVLRFRDLVTEPGGTISEHRNIIRHRGHVWWGWWRRQAEHIPKGVLAGLFNESVQRVPIVLFDASGLGLYVSDASEVVVAPSIVGISSPEFDATPEYYVRGRYPLWFRLEGDITPIKAKSLYIIGRPTDAPDLDKVPDTTAAGDETPLETLRDDRPTLWLCRFTV